MLRHFVSIIVIVLTLIVRLPTVVAVGQTAPATAPEVPRPEECQVMPRSLASLEQLIAAIPTETPLDDAGTRKPDDEITEISAPPSDERSVSTTGIPTRDTGTMPSPSPSALWAPTPVPIPPGIPADAATETAVRAMVREVIACNNAGDALRFVSLVSDDQLIRMFALVASPELLVSELAEPPTPLPEDDWEPMPTIEDVRLLPDGRISALVSLGSSRDTGKPDCYVFVKVGDRWLLDDFPYQLD